MNAELAEYGTPPHERESVSTRGETSELDFEVPAKKKTDIIQFPFPHPKQRLERSKEEFAAAVESLRAVYKFLYPHESLRFTFETETDMDLDETAALNQRHRSLESENTTHTNVLTERAAIEVAEGADSTVLFDKLVERWRSETAHLSSALEICTHSAYQRIIGMGKIAVPLILRELQKDLDHWFWALKAITGEDPVPREFRGNLPQMSQCWLLWGKKHGYLL